MGASPGELTGGAHAARRTRLWRVLRPRSAAFVGGAGLAPAIRGCRAAGFPGEIRAVHPSRAEIAGVPCVPGLGGLDLVPDVAFVATPAAAAVGVVAGLSRLGAGGAICNCSGFAEAGAGASLQRELVDAAGDMPVVGPNCPGIANFLDRSVLMMDHFGSHSGGDGGVAFVSGGGAYLSDVGCAERSVPVAYLVGLGNQASVGVGEMLCALLDDRRVSAVNLYVEDVGDAAALAEAGLRALRQDVPVVAVRGGRSPAGSRAARSHTAALAGDGAAVSALFERLGFAEARTPSEAIETLKALTLTRRPAGRRVALATSSGSYAVLGGDLAEAHGLSLPAPSAAAAEAADRLLPPFVRAKNPLDIATAQEQGHERQLGIYRAFLSDDPDAAVQVMCFPPEGGWDPGIWEVTTRAFAQAARERELPCAFVNTLPEALPRPARERMAADGMAPLMGLEDGMRAIANAVVRHERAARARARPDREVLVGPAPASPAAGAEVALDESEAKALLRGAGVRVPASAVLDGDGAGMPGGLRFPVALKALAAGLAHKTEAGAVALGLADPGAVRAAMARIRSAVGRATPGLRVRRFLVEEMVDDGVVELLVGIRRVDGIGHALTVGAGGVRAELLADTATVLLPAGRDAVAGAIRSLRLAPLLDGWRGRPAADLPAAVDAVCAMCALALGDGGRVTEIEVNPLVVRAAGQGAVAVDALAHAIPGHADNRENP